MTTRQPTRLLVSVRSAAEAVEALAGGAGLIDVKEPARGPLGKPGRGVIDSVCGTVGGQAPVSVAMGEITEDFTDTLPGGVRYAKVGLAHGPVDWPDRLRGFRDRVSPARLIVACYADYECVIAPSPDELLDWASGHGASGVLIDTAVKGSHNLFDWFDVVALGRWVRRAQSAGLLVGVAGSLSGDDFVRAVELRPDVVAVRGAACRGGDRLERVDRRCVRRLAGVIEAGCPSPAGSAG